MQEAIDFCTEWVEQLYWITFGDKQGRLPVDGSDEPSGILPNKYLPLALQIRAQGYAIADQYSAAVSDATEGLKICDYMLSGVMQSGQAHSNVSADDTEFYRCTQLQLFKCRGAAHVNSQNYHDAVTDFRAACAIIQQDTLNGKQVDSKEHAEILENTLRSMALAKLGSERPHYTPRERLKFYQQLMLKDFAPRHYKCASCGGHTVGTELKLCAGCAEVGVAQLYCSGRCQKAAWKAGHRATCGQTVSTGTLVPLDLQEGLSSQVDNLGWAQLEHHAGPCIIMRDMETGGLFDASHVQQWPEYGRPRAHPRHQIEARAQRGDRHPWRL